MRIVEFTTCADAVNRALPKNKKGGRAALHYLIIVALHPALNFNSIAGQYLRIGNLSLRDRFDVVLDGREQSIWIASRDPGNSLR